VEVFNLGSYRPVVVALFCASLILMLCILVLGCRKRCQVRRRRREQKLRQQTKYQQCNDVDAVGCRRSGIPDEWSTVELSSMRSPPPPPPPNSSTVMSIHNVCHCLPRGLRRKSPATAVIRRGRSIESLPPLDRCVAVPPPLTHSSSLAVLPRFVNAGSRPDLVQVSNSDDDESTSGARRWAPITVAGETTFPVQPSSAVYLSFDVDDSVRFSCRGPRET